MHNTQGKVLYWIYVRRTCQMRDHKREGSALWHNIYAFCMSPVSQPPQTPICLVRWLVLIKAVIATASLIDKAVKKRCGPSLGRRNKSKTLGYSEAEARQDLYPAACLMADLKKKKVEDSRKHRTGIERPGYGCSSAVSHDLSWSRIGLRLTDIKRRSMGLSRHRPHSANPRYRHQGISTNINSVRPGK
jgi:hypothetical protein